MLPYLPLLMGQFLRLFGDFEKYIIYIKIQDTRPYEKVQLQEYVTC